MKFPFIDLKTQYQTYKDEIDAAMAQVVESCQFIMGPELTALEKELSDYTGAAHAVVCASGTAALELCLKIAGVQPGDEVITTPFSFFATAEMVSACGATPVFVDIEPDSYNIDPSLIEQAITPKTKAILPVALYGQPAEMEAINAIAQKHGLVVIEDAAQSFGSELGGKKSCNLSELAATSFFPAKPLGCFGDGGALFCRDESQATLARQLLNHGQDKRYSHAHIGMNGRMDAIQAAVLRVKLRYFDQEMEKRKILAKEYDSRLEGIVTIPKLRPNRTSAYAQYTIQVDQRDELCKSLNDKGIPTAVHYPIPLYRQNVYRSMQIDPSRFPVTESVSARVVSLPFSPFLKQEDLEATVEAVKEAVS